MVRLARYARSRSSACRRRRGFTARRRGYDTCANGKGRLCSTATHLSRIATSYTYDPEGNRDSETLSYSLSGLTGSRTSSFAFGPGGRVREQSYPDNATSQTTYKTKAQYLYDDRGQPTTLRWLPANGAAARNVAVQTRNVAGQVLTRVASLSGVAATPASPPWRNFTSTWAYDKLSRVLSQAVTDSSSVAYASQALTYRGLDDPWTMQHKLGGATYNFTFDYSARHELTSVAESGNRYTAAYTFHPSGKLNTATVCAGPLPTCAPQTGGAVLARNATYVYGSMVDPEAPTALTTPSGTFREYAYDTVGNMSSVRPGTGGTPITDGFSYDGDDQLRRAIKYSNGFQTGREEYYYDLDGNRRAVVTLSGLGVPTSARVFIGDAEIELTNTGTINKVYSYLSMGTPVAKVVSPTGGWLQSSSSTVASSVELQYQGLANNTLLSVQPTGVVQSGFVYGPYGDVIQTSGTAGGLTGQHRRFNDKFRDDQTGLSYYGVRYYDPTLLSWTQADPLYRFVPDAAWGDPRRSSLYGFCGGNPLAYLDPDGRGWRGVVRFVRAVSPAFRAAEAAADTGTNVAKYLNSDIGLKTAGRRVLANNLRITGAVVGSKLPLVEGMAVSLADEVDDRTANQGITSEEVMGSYSGGAAAGGGGRRGSGGPARSKGGVEGAIARYVPRGEDGAPLSLPHGPNGELAPSSMAPHTQIGWTEGGNGPYVQTREFGANGVPVKQIDWTDHGRRDHSNPHVHDYVPNPTGGTPQRGGHRAPKPEEIK